MPFMIFLMSSFAVKCYNKKITGFHFSEDEKKRKTKRSFSKMRSYFDPTVFWLAFIVVLKTGFRPRNTDSREKRLFLKTFE